jgi:hypothetical protein
MGVTLAVILTGFYVIMHRRMPCPITRQLCVFMAAAQATLGVAQLTALDDRAFFRVLLPVMGVAAAGIAFIVMRRSSRPQ